MRPHRQAGVLQRQLSEGESVLLNPDGTAALVLNAVASVVWDLCDGERSPEEMASFICETLPGTELEQVTADVRALLGRLAEAGLIELSDPGSSEKEP